MSRRWSDPSRTRNLQLTPSSTIHSCDLDCKGIGERYFLKIIEATRGTDVTGLKVGPKGNQAVVRAQTPKPGDPFGRFPVEHPRIGQTRECEDCRITLR